MCIAFLCKETQLNVTVTVYYSQYHASNMEMGSNQILFERSFYTDCNGTGPSFI